MSKENVEVVRASLDGWNRDASMPSSRHSTRTSSSTRPGVFPDFETKIVARRVFEDARKAAGLEV